MKNKVIIVTVYNSENCGSFLQAYALRKILIKNGYEVSFYKRKRKGTSHSIISHIKPFIKNIIKLKFKNAFFNIKIWYNFETAIKQFNTCNLNSSFYKNTSTIIIGSDTLWNLESNYFVDNFLIYSGNIFKGKRNITYAISAANTNKDHFKKLIKQYNGINITDFLVRDYHTKYLIKESTENDAEIVCDPTLLLHSYDYDDIISKRKISKPYLLLYYFDEINQKQQIKIKEFAQNNNLLIISFITNRKWCDKSIIASPNDMIFYFKNASYILTDTFHGTAFSLIYEKKFAVFEEGKNKVKELLITYNMNDHLFNNYNNLSEILYKPNNVVKEGIYDIIRDKSETLLLTTLKDYNNGNM